MYTQIQILGQYNNLPLASEILFHFMLQSEERTYNKKTGNCLQK